ADVAKRVGLCAAVEPQVPRECPPAGLSDCLAELAAGAVRCEETGDDISRWTVLRPDHPDVGKSAHQPREQPCALGEPPPSRRRTIVAGEIALGHCDPGFGPGEAIPRRLLDCRVAFGSSQ